MQMYSDSPPYHLAVDGNRPLPDIFSDKLSPNWYAHNDSTATIPANYFTRCSSVGIITTLHAGQLRNHGSVTGTSKRYFAFVKSPG